MPSASQVAQLILALADEEELISNLKLQKLLYYAQGFFLAIHRAPLFPEPIKAWEHGPVVPAVWQEYRDFGANAIPPHGDIDLGAFADREADVVKEVYAVYGQFSAWKLRNMTHDEAPWSSTPRDAVISHKKLADYFVGQLTDDAHDDPTTQG